jgi:hypothetical protein
VRQLQSPNFFAVLPAPIASIAVCAQLDQANVHLNALPRSRLVLHRELPRISKTKVTRSVARTARRVRGKTLLLPRARNVEDKRPTRFGRDIVCVPIIRSSTTVVSLDPPEMIEDPAVLTRCCKTPDASIVRLN